MGKELQGALPAILGALPDLPSPLESVRIAIGENREFKGEQQCGRKRDLKTAHLRECNLTGWPGGGAVLLLSSRNMASQRLGRPRKG